MHFFVSLDIILPLQHNCKANIKTSEVKYGL